VLSSGEPIVEEPVRVPSGEGNLEQDERQEEQAKACPQG